MTATRILVLLFLIVAQFVFAQSKTDTVQRGYYIPFDSNYVSCKVAITPVGKKVVFTNTTGNKLPDSLMNQISYLEPGSVVVYSEVTVMKKGTFEKADGKRYVVGTNNTGVVKRDPFYPDTLTAKEIGSIILPPHVHDFHVSWTNGGNYYTYTITGNAIFGEARTAIEALPSGTRVWIEDIRYVDERNLPDEVHVVR